MRKIRVLIAEDEPHLRLLYELELRREGFDTEAAADADECLRSLARTCPDLVVLDYGIPGMSGLELMQRIRDRHRVPIVVNTGYSDLDRTATAQMADALVVKSADLSELVAAVREQVGLSRHTECA
ncbi:MAG: response regulator [Candidatus Krumholzibacteriia bacterium]